MFFRFPFRLVSVPGIALLSAWGVSAADFRITGPYTHDNLSIYLLHGAASGAGKQMLTLQEAMDQKKVVVHETGRVNELAIENLSTEDVWVQSGDIVKGGQQDRVLTTDLVLPQHSGKLPISSFCVERGRWMQRGSEPVRQFSASTRALPAKSLKLAVREEKDQHQVWASVDRVRAKLAQNSGAGEGAAGRAGAGGVVGGVISARPPMITESQSSMQLALENQRVVAATGPYVQALVKIIDGKNDVVGYAYAINGNLNSADVYGSPDLFRKMWPKMLEASAAEALAERTGGQAAAAPTPSSVSDLLGGADRAREASTEGTGRVTVSKKMSEKVILFEARDREESGQVLHKSYVVK